MNATTLDSTAAPQGTPRLPSVWQALFWKEWRQQWLAALLIGLLCLVLYLLSCHLDQGRGEGTALLVVFSLACLSLGTQAFASEKEDRTEEFLAGLPLPTWKLLLTKCLVSIGLASLVLAVCALAVFPGSDEWLPRLGQHNRLIGPPTPTRILLFWGLFTFACGSGMVALTGILGRLGFGSMGTWLAVGVFGTVASATTFYGAWLTAPQLSPYVVLATWAMVHLWLLRVWLGPATARRRSWRTGFWTVSILLVPVTIFICAAVVERVWLECTHPVALARLTPQTRALPSPDGRTVLLTTVKVFADHSQHAATWLLDVDTGGTERLGSRWRDSRQECGAPPVWSPDGKHVRTVSMPLLTNWFNPHAWFEEVPESLYRVSGRDGVLVDRRTIPQEYRSSWLRNGMQVRWTPSAWEFVEPQTGDVHRCLHPAGGIFTDRYTPVFWTDDAVFAVAATHGEKRGVHWHVWRSAPGLPEAQCIDVELSLAENERGFWPRKLFSGDGRWALFECYHPHSLWLQPLDGGMGHSIKLPSGVSPGVACFTGDSSLLVVFGQGEVGTWSLAESRWETAIETTLPDAVTSSVYGLTSPGRPWRLALFSYSEERIHVANLEDGTVQEVFPKEAPSQSFRRVRRLCWLGNDRLLVAQAVLTRYELWVVDANGTNSRQVLP